MLTASTTESAVETTTDAGLAIVAPLLADKRSKKGANQRPFHTRQCQYKG